MKIDIILPTMLDLTYEGYFVPCVEDSDREDFYLNEECTLLIRFDENDCSKFKFEYWSDQDIFILETMFPELDTQCTIENHVAKQYEIAAKMNVQTIDI